MNIFNGTEIYNLKDDSQSAAIMSEIVRHPDFFSVFTSIIDAGNLAQEDDLVKVNAVSQNEEELEKVRKAISSFFNCQAKLIQQPDNSYYFEIFLGYKNLEK